eukprot:RCo015905
MFCEVNTNTHPPGGGTHPHLPPAQSLIPHDDPCSPAAVVSAFPLCSSGACMLYFLHISSGPTVTLLSCPPPSESSLTPPPSLLCDPLFFLIVLLTVFSFLI